eukprot:g79520.t1
MCGGGVTRPGHPNTGYLDVLAQVALADLPAGDVSVYVLAGAGMVAEEAEEVHQGGWESLLHNADFNAVLYGTTATAVAYRIFRRITFASAFQIGAMLGAITVAAQIRFPKLRHPFVSLYDYVKAQPAA